MKEKFKEGDEVVITTLNSEEKGPMDGKIGHIGKITLISEGWHFLEPSCVGGCWPEDCLELVEPEYPSVEELRKNSNIEFV